MNGVYVLDLCDDRFFVTWADGWDDAQRVYATTFKGESTSIPTLLRSFHFYALPDGTDPAAYEYDVFTKWVGLHGAEHTMSTASLMNAVYGRTFPLSLEPARPAHMGLGSGLASESSSSLDKCPDDMFPISV